MRLDITHLVTCPVIKIGPTVMIATATTIVTVKMTVIAMTALALVTQEASRVVTIIITQMIALLALTHAAALGHVVIRAPPVNLQAHVVCTAKTMMITTSLMHIMVT